MAEYKEYKHGKPNTRKANSSTSGSYRFESIRLSSDQVEAIKLWGNYDTKNVADWLTDLCIAGWKVSLSEHQSTGRIVCSVTDKRSRRAYQNRVFSLEHVEAARAIFGMLFYVSELLTEDDGGAGTDDQYNW